MSAKTPNQVIGVIAHETGHITGGHLARLRTQVSRAKSAALMLQLIGLAAMVGGALAGVPGTRPGRHGRGLWRAGRGLAQLARLSAGRGIVGRPGRCHLPQCHQAIRPRHDRDLRVHGHASSSACRASIPICKPTRCRSNASCSSGNSWRSSPYYNNVDRAELQFRHDLMKAKLFGFLDEPQTVFNRYPETDQSLPALYARAIATYRKSGHEGRRAADRCADRRQARLALFLRDQRPVPVRERQPGRRGCPRCARR